jgi:hypothetical protein
MNHTHRRLPWRTALVVGLLATVLTAAPRAALSQEPARPTASFAGTYALRFILGSEGLNLTPVGTWAEIAGDAQDSLLIVLGSDAGLPEDARPWRDEDQLTNFMAKGGAVFIATDQRTPEAVKQVFGVEVAGQYCHTEIARYQYRNKLANCPIIRPRERPTHAIFTGLTNVVATNVPSYLSRRGGWQVPPYQATPVAYLPPAGWPDGRLLNESLATGRPLVPEFAAAFPGAPALDGPEPRALIVADDSVFIDGMMLQRDISNFDFAWNCVDWLTLKPQGRRGKVLFLDHGTVVTDLGIPANWKVYPPIPLPPDLMTLADKVIAEGGNGLINMLDTNSALDETIRQNVLPEEILRVVAVVGTLGLVVLGSVRLWRVRHRFDPTVPLFAAALQGQAAARTTLDDRHQALVDEGNLWEAARDAARQCLGSLGAAAGAAPRVTVAGPWRARWRLRWQLYQLRRLARGDRSRRVGRRGFRRVLRWCSQMQEARAAGNLRVDGASKGHV